MLAAIDIFAKSIQRHCCEEGGHSPQPCIILLQNLNCRTVTPADCMLQRSVAPSACKKQPEGPHPVVVDIPKLDQPAAILQHTLFLTLQLCSYVLSWKQHEQHEGKL